MEFLTTNDKTSLSISSVRNNIYMNDILVFENREKKKFVELFVLEITINRCKIYKAKT